MNLQKSVTLYVTYRRSLGAKFQNNERCLQAFVRSVGHNKNLSDIQDHHIKTFIDGKGPNPKNVTAKYSNLRGLYNYALSRGYIKISPLPTVFPKWSKSFIPYIYNEKELKSLFNTSLIYQESPNRHRLRPHTVSTILLLLYGCLLYTSRCV